MRSSSASRACAIACASLCLVPGVARADGPGAAVDYLSPVRSIVLACGVLGVAYLLNRFAPSRRRRVRRALLLFLFYLAGAAAAIALRALHLAPWDEQGAYIAYLLQALTTVNLAGLVVFDVALPAIRLAVADIVGDLVVGASYFVVSIAVLRTAGVNLSGIVATSAVVTGVLGLSLQATLSNVIGGVALQLDGSVHVGDWLQLENGKQGKVTEIRWRHTVLETRDFDTIVVPNATLLAQNITVLGKRGGKPVPHRMWLYFSVDFRKSPSEVIEVVDAALQGAPMANVAADPRPHCICMDLGRENRDSYAIYAVRYWLTDLAADDPTSSAVRTRVYAALKRAHIPLAIGAATRFVSNDDDETARRKTQREQARRVAALDAVDLFATMTAEEKAALAGRIHLVTFAPGEIITHQGATAHWFYVLTQGTVDVRVRSPRGDDTVVSQTVAPGFFGEMGMMTGEPRSATIAANTEVECYRIDKTDFRLIVTARPQIASEISRILAERQIALADARGASDASDRQSRIGDAHGKILLSVRSFFGLDDDAQRR